MKQFTIVLLVLLVMSCIKTNQKQLDHDVAVVIEEQNNYYEIIDWDKLISIRLEEYINNNREDQYNESGFTIYEKYISNTMIASLDIIFCYYTVLDEYFSSDEKKTLIKKLREEYTTYDYDNVFEYFPETEFNDLSIEDGYYIINTWKMITALFIIFNESTALNEYISLEDKDRIVAKALLDFFKTELSWSIGINSLTKFFPFPFVRFKSNMDNVRTYSVDRNTYLEGQTNTIIHYKTKTGVINAAYVGFLDDFEYPYHQIGIDLWNGLYLVLALEDDAYIFVDGNIYTGEAFYTAIKVFDEKIEPYPVFNGFNTLSYPSTHWSLGRGICGSGFGPKPNDIDDKSPFWIGINYNGREKIYNDGSEDIIYPDWDTLTFTFNGSEFAGDYDLFNELIKIK